MSQLDKLSRGSVVDAELAVPRSRHQPRELRLADVNERRVIVAFEIDVGTTLLWRDGSIRRSAQRDTLARARLVRQSKRTLTTGIMAAPEPGGGDWSQLEMHGRAQSMFRRRTGGQ